MRTIHKYTVNLKDLDQNGRVLVDMPIGASVLSVGRQHDDFNVKIWVEVYTENRNAPREFYFIGTGRPFPDGIMSINYVGTVQLHDGDLMLHVYERMQ